MCARVLIRHQNYQLHLMPPTFDPVLPAIRRPKRDVCVPLRGLRTGVLRLCQCCLCWFLLVSMRQLHRTSPGQCHTVYQFAAGMDLVRFWYVAKYAPPKTPRRPASCRVEPVSRSPRPIWLHLFQRSLLRCDAQPIRLLRPVARSVCAIPLRYALKNRVLILLALVIHLIQPDVFGPRDIHYTPCAHRGTVVHIHQCARRQMRPMLCGALPDSVMYDLQIDRGFQPMHHRPDLAFLQIPVCRLSMHDFCHQRPMRVVKSAYRHQHQCRYRSISIAQNQGRNQMLQLPMRCRNRDALNQRQNVRPMPVIVHPAIYFFLHLFRQSAHSVPARIPDSVFQSIRYLKCLIQSACGNYSPFFVRISRHYCTASSLKSCSHKMYPKTVYPGYIARNSSRYSHTWA